MSLFAARLGSPAVPVRLHAERTAEGWQISGFPTDVAGARSLLLVADPFTFPVDALLDELARAQPGLAVVGGMASAANAPGDNRLLVDESSYIDGAVGALLAEGVSPQAVVSQGCRPIGRPYIVTRADGHMIHELGGRPALERLLTTLERLPPGDRHLAEQGLHRGVVIDETKDEFERGDFLIRGVLGVDRATGAVAVGDSPAVGSTVQFQVRDAASADEDLHALLTGRAARGAVVFTCNGRGRRLFGTPDHDAMLVGDLLGNLGGGRDVLCRRARAGRRPQLRPRLHRLDRHLPVGTVAPAPYGPSQPSARRCRARRSISASRGTPPRRTWPGNPVRGTPTGIATLSPVGEAADRLG